MVGEITERPVRSPHTNPLAAILLIAGVVQLFAVARLGRWNEAVLTRAALEGPGIYIATILVAVVAIAVNRRLWFHPRRTREIAAATTAVLIAGFVWWLSSRVSWSGFVYHGEYILHHFLAVCSAVVAWSLARVWQRQRDLGRLRYLPFAAAAVGIVLLLGAHLASVPRLALELPTWLADVGVGAFISAPLLALAALPKLGGWSRRLVALLVFTPLIARVLLTGTGALHGALVPDDLVVYLLASFGVCACSLWFLPGSTPPRGTRVYLWVLAAGATYFLYSMYTQKYGFVEADLASLGHSILGFDLVYPGYVPTWLMLTCSLGLTALLAGQWEALFVAERRTQGLALGLLTVAGLGLSSPQVALMSGLGGLLLVHSLQQHASAPARAIKTATEVPIPAIFDDIASKLKLPDVVSLAQPTYTLLSLRGEISGTAVRMQARTRDEVTWSVELEVGVIGRGEPHCELRPGRRGREHAIDGLTETHRVFGNARELERLSPTLFDHLAACPDAAFSVWPGGFRIVFGNQLGELTSKRARALISLLVGLHSA